MDMMVGTIMTDHGDGLPALPPWTATGRSLLTVTGGSCLTDGQYTIAVTYSSKLLLYCYHKWEGLG